MYYSHRTARAYERVPRCLKSGVIEPLVNLLPVKTRNLSFDYRARRFLSGANYDEVARHHIWFGSFAPPEQDSLLTEATKQSSDGDVYRDARRMLAECDSVAVIERIQSLEAQL